jgi:hypothetical protein
MPATAFPPWIDQLNALQSEWREAELLRGRDPDPYIENLLRVLGSKPDAVPRARIAKAPWLI